MALLDALKPNGFGCGSRTQVARSTWKYLDLRPQGIAALRDEQSGSVHAHLEATSRQVRVHAEGLHLWGTDGAISRIGWKPSTA